MSKRVIVVASGETERRALPRLVRWLRKQGIVAEDVRIPPRNRTLNVEMAEKLIKAAWYESLNEPPDKFVVVLDVDRADPAEVLKPMQTQLPERVREVTADVLYAYAQAHLEAWYFADADNLRGYLGRALGHVDTSKPDEIDNPKLQLRNLLGERVYTARVSAGIAEALDAATIVQRSPSFGAFVHALMNGTGGAVPSSAPGGQPAESDDDGPQSGMTGGPPWSTLV